MFLFFPFFFFFFYTYILSFLFFCYFLIWFCDCDMRYVLLLSSIYTHRYMYRGLYIHDQYFIVTLFFSFFRK